MSDYPMSVFFSFLEARIKFLSFIKPSVNVCNARHRHIIKCKHPPKFLAYCSQSMTPINVALCTIRPLLSMALLKQIPPRAGQLSEGGAKLTYMYTGTLGLRPYLPMQPNRIVTNVIVASMINKKPSHIPPK